jgi:hypothetical protein
VALTRWRWIGGPVVAALAVAIAILPPRVPSGDTVQFGFFSGPGYVAGSAQAGRSQFVSDVLAARRIQAWRLRRARVADSIVSVARGPRALRSPGRQITVAYERPLTADSARFWLDAATRELALYPGGPRVRIPVVVALLSDTVRDRPERRADNMWGVQELVDQAASVGACVVTVNLIPRQSWLQPAVGHDAAGHAVGRVLGACALYARFGLPGPGVSRWVGSGFEYSGRSPITMLQEARRHVFRLQLQHTFGPFELESYGGVRWAVVGCLTGVDTLCLRSAGLSRESGSQGPYWFYSTVGRVEVISYQLATGTPEAFGAFWRSPLPPAEALAAAYGRPAGGLVMTALRHWYWAPAPAARWGGARNVLAGLAWVGLALAASLAAGRHWKSET